ncbi:phage terminase small subunit [Enterococcus faecalis]|uniref:phage terminase small subunit n=1 Tax=Enterococcus faecalis TaxID=1351 RepID=UPI002A18B49C|nr:phage terminase small subunit [Enterococcus faecalis]WPL33046.1 phage terminase small subunit [Enterococcus faecalis]
MKKGWKYKDISEKLSVPLNTLKSWRKRDKWERGGATKEVQPTNRGAPKGNQNAIGNKGNSRASPPKRNKNAVKTGEYETIFADMLSDEEKDIYSTMNDDPFFILDEEIRILKIRQYRMLKRIKDAEAGLNDEEVERLQQLRKVKEPSVIDGKMVTVKREVLKDVQVTRKTFRKLDDILAIEDALTRVSNQLIKAIKQQKELLSTDKKSLLMEAQIEKIKLETDKLSGGSSNDEADSWKQAVINAANKRAVEENE